MLLVDWYAFQSVKVATDSLQSNLRTALQYFYWSFTVLSILAFSLYSTELHLQIPKPIWTTFRTVLFIAFVAKLPIVLFTGIDDLRRIVLFVISKFKSSSTEVVYDYSRSKFVSNVAVIAGLIPFSTLFYGIVRNPYRYKIHRNNVVFPDLPSDLDGFKIIQISDIHSGSFTFKEPIFNAIKMINDEKADLICFTGDLVNSRSDEMQPYMDVFNQLRSKFGVYSIFGNHDYGDYATWDSQEQKANNLSNLVNIHKKLGWSLLRNENTSIQVNDAQLDIIGVENYSALPQFQKYGDLHKAYQGVAKDSFKLLLSHDPSHWDYEVSKKFSDINLTLSGHTHGFQFGIEIPGWLRWSPSQYMYKQWAGLYQEGMQYLYVNRGLGFLGYPGRVGILPEITVLTLKKA